MAPSPESVQLSADEALAKLMAGNQRFLRGQARSAAFRREPLADLAKAQRPYATILGCSDSRVPPEWLFDTGLGEVFVVRVAGNSLSTEVAGSLQYAGSHLQTPLFVILGHEGCGAIAAALATKYEGEQFRSTAAPDVPIVAARRFAATAVRDRAAHRQRPRARRPLAQASRAAAGCV